MKNYLVYTVRYSFNADHVCIFILFLKLIFCIIKLISKIEFAPPTLKRAPRHIWWEELICEQVSRRKHSFALKFGAGPPPNIAGGRFPSQTLESEAGFIGRAAIVCERGHSLY